MLKLEKLSMALTWHDDVVGAAFAVAVEDVGKNR